MKIVELTAELVIGFVMLFLVVKVAGKKMIHQITPFTFISAIVLGELLGNALYDDHVHIWYIVYSITVWGVLLILVEYMSQKWLRFRGIAEGKPTALIRNGMIDYEALKKIAHDAQPVTKLASPKRNVFVKGSRFLLFGSKRLDQCIEKVTVPKNEEGRFSTFSPCCLRPNNGNPRRRSADGRTSGVRKGRRMATARTSYFRCDKL